MRALGRPDLTVDPSTFVGERGDDAVRDGGVVTGPGTAQMASANLDVDGAQGHATIGVLVAVAEEPISNTRCGIAGGEVACTLTEQENGGTVLVQRKEIPGAYTAQEINVYDPVQELRIRVNTYYPDGEGILFTDEELMTLVTDDVWALQVPAEHYVAGQAVPFLWVPGQPVR